jgi:hypothetical protein
MEEVEQMSFHPEKRMYPRFELSQALAYRCGTTKGTLLTADLSLGGVKIQTDSPMPADERVDIILLVDYETVRLAGKIVWAKPLPSRKFDIGISFEAISYQSFEQLDRFLKGTTLRDKPAKHEKGLGQSGPEDSNTKSFESDRLRSSFPGWKRDEYNAHFGFLDSVKAEFDKLDTGVIFLVNREVFYARFWGKPTKLASALKQLLGKDFRKRDVRELMYALSIGSRKSLKFPRDLIRLDFVEILTTLTSEEDKKEWQKIFSEIDLEAEKK